MKRTMIMVVVALMPALLFGFYNTGYLHFLSQGVQPEFWASLWFGFLKVLPIIVVSYVVGLGIEFAFAQARGHEVNEGFLVTGLLIPMIIRWTSRCGWWRWPRPSRSSSARRCSAVRV